MRTYKLTLEVLEDGKPALTFRCDETVVTAEVASAIIKACFTEAEKVSDKEGEKK